MIKFTKYYLGRPKVVRFFETKEELKAKIEEAKNDNNAVDYKYEIDNRGEKKCFGLMQ